MDIPLSIANELVTCKIAYSCDVLLIEICSPRIYFLIEFTRTRNTRMVFDSRYVHKMSSYMQFIAYCIMISLDENQLMEDDKGITNKSKTDL